MHNKQLARTMLKLVYSRQITVELISVGLAVPEFWFAATEPRPKSQQSPKGRIIEFPVRHDMGRAAE